MLTNVSKFTTCLQITINYTILFIPIVMMKSNDIVPFPLPDQIPPQVPRAGQFGLPRASKQINNPKMGSCCNRSQQYYPNVGSIQL